MDATSWDPINFAFWDQLWDDSAVSYPVKPYHYCENQLCCARREAVGSCFHPCHCAALCCCSGKCVHKFCQPFEEALIREGWGPALLGDGEAPFSWGILSCSPRGPWCCSYTVTKSLPVPGNVPVCVMCGTPDCTIGQRLQIVSAREYGSRPWLEDSLFLLALHSWEKIKLWCGVTLQSCCFDDSCAGRCSFTVTEIDVYLNPVHWSCVENVLRHPKSHTWLFPVFRGMEQWVTLLGLGDIHLQISFLISLYLSFLFIQVGSEKQHLPASHHIHIHCCWGGFTTAAGKVSDQSCTLKCQSFGYLFIHKAHRSSQACHSEQTQHKAHSNSTWRCLHKGQLLINEWISHSVKHISVLHKL